MSTCQNHPTRPIMARGLCAACYMRERRAASITYMSRAPAGSNYAEALQRAEDWADRFWGKVDKSGDCHVWTAAKNQQGYGVFFVANRTLLARRLAAALAGLDYQAAVIAPTCGNPACVNPEHMELRA